MEPNSTPNHLHSTEDVVEGVPMIPSAFEDLNKIRDILFGSQSQQIAAHLDQLERRLMDESQALRNSFEEQITRLENDTSERFQAMREALTDESKERQAAEATLTQAINARFEALTREMQANFEQQAAHLTDEAQTRNQAYNEQQQALKQLDKVTQENRSADKKELSNLLQKMADVLAKG